MNFLFVAFLLERAGIYLLPKLLGSRTMAFPTPDGAGILVLSLRRADHADRAAVGVAPAGTAGSCTRRLSSAAHSPGVNADIGYWG